MKHKNFFANYKVSLRKVGKTFVHKWNLFKLELRHYKKISMWNLKHDVDKILLCIFYGYEEYVILEMYHHQQPHHSKDLSKLTRSQLIEIVFDRQSSKLKPDSVGLNCYDFTLLYTKDQFKYLEPIMVECGLNYSEVGLGYVENEDTGTLDVTCKKCDEIEDIWGRYKDDYLRPDVFITCQVCGNVYLSTISSEDGHQHITELGRDFDTTSSVEEDVICIGY